ncbi:MAG: hypothetical protein KF754_11170 [Planctomycetes bacterium]|nr:hypothetical protein [Planctomycetota bacterium]
MKIVASFLLLLTLAACGAGGPNALEKEQIMQSSAKVAERNLQKIRDGILAYHKKHQKSPKSVDDLSEVGAGPENLETSEDYADLGYSFYAVEFAADGTLKQGWLLASPRADREAMRVRMNAVNGEVDLTKPGDAMGAAPGDRGGTLKQGANQAK